MDTMTGQSAPGRRRPVMPCAHPFVARLAGPFLLAAAVAACGDDDAPFVHDDPPFAVAGPAGLEFAPGDRTDDPMYSLLAQWQFAGQGRIIAVAVFDEPRNPDWIADWGAQHNPRTIGGGVAAQGIVTLSDSVYERHVLVTHPTAGRVVELSLTLSGVDRWLERPLHEIEAEFDEEIGAYETMLASFRWGG